MDVVIGEWMGEPGLSRLTSQYPVLYDPDLWRRPADLARVLADARALVVRNQARVDAGLLTAAPRLRIVGRLGAGLDNIDVAACRRRGIEVANTPVHNAQAVAEHTLALVLALARRLPQAHSDTAAGGWRRTDFVGAELSGRTVGIVGPGQIGQCVAGLFAAVGMRVIGWHPRRGPDDPLWSARAITPRPFEALLGEADVVSLHCPLNEETRGLMGAEQLARMRPTSFLVNTARGGLVDEAALADALRSGRLAGAALDVRAAEPPRQPDPLAGCPNLILTPHVAGLTAEAQARISEAVAEAVMSRLG